MPRQQPGHVDLTAAGILRTGSLMVPYPWAAEMLDYAAADQIANTGADLGVHLTLNSEWARWLC